MTPADDSRALALDLLLGNPAGARAAARGLDEQQGWTSAVVICSDWGALPQLGRRLEELGHTLDGPAHEKFRRWAGAVFLQSAARLHQGALAYTTLADAGVGAVVIKGAAAIAALYGGPRDRTIGDVDILVRASDVDAAVAALTRAGFRAGLDRAAMPGDLARVELFGGNRAVPMRAPDGSDIDLHVEMGRVNTDAVLNEARQAEIYGRTVRVTSHAHGFLIGVHHMLRNGFVLDRAVRDLLDCHGWLHALHDTREAASSARQAADWGLAAPGLAVMRALAQFNPDGPAAAWSAAFAGYLTDAERQRARTLSDVLLRQRVSVNWNPDLLALLSPGALFQFVKRSTVAGQTHYRWFMRTGTARRQGALPLGTRLSRLGRSLPRADWRLLWALKDAQNRAFK